MCVEVGGEVQEPRRVEGATPRRGDGAVDYSVDYACEAEYHLLINEQGFVAKVELRSDSPTGCSKANVYHARLRIAMRNWRYERTLVKGQPVAVCLPYTAKVDLRRRQ